MYTDNKESFKLNGRFSESYTILRGVKQGSIFSGMGTRLLIHDSPGISSETCLHEVNQVKTLEPIYMGNNEEDERNLLAGK